MERLLLIFVRRLRQAGLSIGLGEVIDAGRALACLDVTDEQAVRTTLRSTLIKNACDFAVFDKVFELTFYVPDDKEQAEAGRLFPAFAVDGSGVGFAGAGSYRGELERVLENPEKLGSFVAELSSIIPLPDNCLDPDVLLHQVKVSLGWFMVKASLEKEKSADAKEKKQLLVQLQKEIKRRIERRLLMERGDAGLAAVVEKVALNTLDFVNLTDAQQHAVMQEVDKLAARIHQGFGRRFRPSRSPGQLDLRRTCRALMQRGRLPGSFRYKKKKPRPAKLVVLCDWSGSVRPYSMFLLRLVYALYQRFPSTSVFLFIDRIADITFYLDKFGFTEGLARALDEAVFSHTNNSDYGTVFYLFWRYYLQQLSKDTILLIYGDAKNLFKADERLFFAKIAEKAGKVFWLNPQPKEKWNTHDSIIKHYEPYCNAVVECGNLKQLRDAVELLK
jgi:uncharacterized protein with von Willebrand factor type A (vWA) domain